MKFSYAMSIRNLVEEMNLNGSQDKLYKASKATGKAIPKDVIPYLFKVADYERKGNKYVAKTFKYVNATVEELLPLARDLEQAAKASKKAGGNAENKVKPTSPKVKSNGLENRLDLIPPQDATEFILKALDLSLDELVKLKQLALSNTSIIEPLHESIKKLGSRERGNKTYYLSKEIVELVADFTKEKNIKVSEFLELALLEAIEKYK